MICFLTWGHPWSLYKYVSDYALGLWLWFWLYFVSVEGESNREIVWCRACVRAQSVSLVRSKPQISVPPSPLFPILPTGLSYFHCGIRWNRGNSSDIKWNKSKSKWYQMIPSESKWVQVNPSDSKWIQEFANVFPMFLSKPSNPGRFQEEKRKVATDLLEKEHFLRVSLFLKTCTLKMCSFSPETTILEKTTTRKGPRRFLEGQREGSNRAETVFVKNPQSEKAREGSYEVFAHSFSAAGNDFLF